MIIALFVARRRKKLALTTSVTSLRFGTRHNDDDDDDNELHGSDVNSYGSADDQPPPAAVGNYVDSINLDRYVMHSEDVRVGETYVNPLRVHVLRVGAAPTYFARAVVNSGDGTETRALGDIRTAQVHRLGATGDDEPIYSRACAYPTVNVPEAERDFALDEEDDEPLYECASSLSAGSSSRDIYSMATSATASSLSSASPLSTVGRDRGRTIDRGADNEPNYAWASPNPDEDIYDNIYEMAAREGLMDQPIYSRARGNSFKHNR